MAIGLTTLGEFFGNYPNAAFPAVPAVKTATKEKEVDIRGKLILDTYGKKRIAMALKAIKTAGLNSCSAVKSFPRAVVSIAHSSFAAIMSVVARVLNAIQTYFKPKSTQPDVCKVTITTTANGGVKLNINVLNDTSKQDKAARISKALDTACVKEETVDFDVTGEITQEMIDTLGTTSVFKGKDKEGRSFIAFNLQKTVKDQNEEMFFDEERTQVLEILYKKDDVWTFHVSEFYQGTPCLGNEDGESFAEENLVRIEALFKGIEVDAGIRNGNAISFILAEPEVELTY